MVSSSYNLETKRPVIRGTTLVHMKYSDSICTLNFYNGNSRSAYFLHYLLQPVFFSTIRSPIRLKNTGFDSQFQPESSKTSSKIIRCRIPPINGSLQVSYLLLLLFTATFILFLFFSCFTMQDFDIDKLLFYYRKCFFFCQEILEEISISGIFKFYP